MKQELDYQTWYFVFTDGTNMFYRFLKKDFRHVIAFCEINGLVTVIEPTLNAVLIKHYYDPKDRNIPIYAEDIAKLWKKDFNWHIIRKKTTYNKKKKLFSWKNALPTCVSIIKAVSCYHSAAQTPYQLYKSLLRNGGEEL